LPALTGITFNAKAANPQHVFVMLATRLSMRRACPSQKSKAKSTGRCRARHSGLGTFNALDGEMIALDPPVWQVPASGRPARATNRVRLPFP